MPRPSVAVAGARWGLVLTVALIAAGRPAWSGRASFVEDFAEPSAWTTNTPATAVRAVEDPREGSLRGLEWHLPAMQPGVCFVQRPLPIPVDGSYEIRFAVSCPEPMAVEVQLAIEGEARLFHIVHLDRAGWQDVAVPVARMTPFAGFSQDQMGGPLFLRFWVDGNRQWAGGAVPRGRELSLVFADLAVTSPLADLPEGIGARLRVRPGEVVGSVHPHIYGHFLEHIYHSVEGGLFGELIANRAFVGPHGFHVQDGTLVQETLAPDVKLFAGDPSWTDYEFSLRARKTGGQEGFLIIFRAADDRNFYWWNLGGWGNVRHALEAEVDDARHIAGEAVAGRIETGRWYDIRVRAEGDHLEGWVDGAKLLDVRDAPHPRGRVGIGTWVTAAEFRDFRVTDLRGNELPIDFEKAVGANAAPDEWTAFPPGDASAVSLVRAPDSPNTGWAARIDLASGEGSHGIAQDRLNIVGGHKYVGSAWLRAEGAVRNVRVALMSADGTVLGSRRLAAPKQQWAAREFPLSPKRGDPSATLTLTAEGDGALLADMVSMMRDDSVETGCRADLLGAVKALKPTIIRWPGGCFASIYRWKRAIGPQHDRRPFYNSPWGEWDSAGFGTDEFVRFCRAVGAEPLIVLNLGSWDSPDKAGEYLGDALDWIEYCNGDASTPMGKLRARNGHPEPYHVTHWELDNETWGMGVDAYAERVIEFAGPIRERWPGLRLYACTFWEKDDPRLLSLAGRYFDVISYHLYEDPANFAQGPLGFESIWSRYPALIAAGPNPKATLAITEWNAQSTDWRTGLFAGGLLNVMERLDVIEMASPALFLRRVDAPAWDNAFINHDRAGWFPAPNYVVWKLYRDHYQPNRVALDAAGPLNAVATASEDGRTLVLKVVNPSPEEVACAIEIEGGFAPRRARQWTVQASLEDRNTLEEPSRIAPVEKALECAEGAFVHRFPAYSVSVIEVRR